MAEYTIFKLKNLTPLHIGTGKENYDFSSDELSSDTISSALAAIRAQQGKTNDIEGFLRSFTVSSAFPFIGDMIFLPRPLGRLDVSVNGQEEHQYRKELKKIKYIELSLWQSLITGQHISIEQSQIEKSFLLPLTDALIDTPSSKQVMQRMSINRDNQKSDPFFFEWQYFAPSAGLYFIVDAPKTVTLELQQLAVELGEIGLGTDKSVGGGKFEVDTETIHINDADNPTASMLLSTYIPSQDELDLLQLNTATYSLLHRDGYIAGSNQDQFQHLRKKSIYMFSPGSFFHTLEHLDGKIVDLRPDWNDNNLHPVFRSGKPFVIQIHNEPI